MPRHLDLHARPPAAAGLSTRPCRSVRARSSDDEGAAAEIGELAKQLGFAPIQLGGLSEGGQLVQACGNSWQEALDLLRAAIPEVKWLEWNAAGAASSEDDLIASISAINASDHQKSHEA
jgi:pimeloyl-ACP methyl ester carboxylesterase